MPVYSPVPQYYDQQPPQYLPMSSYSMGPATSDYYDDSGYYNSNNYYYVPPVQRRHQRQDRYPSYGLPTYRGEYKPTPYYYAHAPSYSYSDDHESNNPLDDLHEEMLQEDERERARDYLPVGQEQWYESPSRHTPDSTFLRNLIMYNNQMSSLRNKQFDSNEEYEEYEDVEPEYYDTPYADNRNTYNSYVNPYTGSTSTGNSNNQNPFNKISSLRNSMAKNAVEDDEEVQELKSLIHQQKNSRVLQQQQQQQQPQQQPPQQSPPQQQQQLSFEQQTPYPMQDIKQQQQRSLANDYQHYTNTDSWQQDSPAYNQYDYDNEYDDAWTHWDSKRNVQPKKLILPAVIATTTMTTSVPTTATTEKPKVEIVQGRNGQKEVVLPRPAVPVRNPFANVIPPRPQGTNMVSHQSKSAAKATGSSSSSPAGTSVYDTIKKIINMQQNLEDADLRQQLDSQKHKGPRINKRFVSTAESLVQQLDGLKRTA